MSKDHCIFDALGGTDELNAHIGVACEHCRLEQNGIEEYLTEVCPFYIADTNPLIQFVFVMPGVEWGIEFRASVLVNRCRVLRF